MVTTLGEDFIWDCFVILSDNCTLQLKNPKQSLLIPKCMFGFKHITRISTTGISQPFSVSADSKSLSTWHNFLKRQKNTCWRNKKVQLNFINRFHNLLRKHLALWQNTVLHVSNLKNSKKVSNSIMLWRLSSQ